MVEVGSNYTICRYIMHDVSMSCVSGSVNACSSLFKSLKGKAFIPSISTPVVDCLSEAEDVKQSPSTMTEFPVRLGCVSPITVAVIIQTSSVTATIAYFYPFITPKARK